MARPRYKTSSLGHRREQKPKVVERNGVVLFECPYCLPPHPLMIGSTAHCGTTLQLTAVQRLYTSVKCAKCGKTSGTLTKVGDKYQHTVDCVPGQILLPEAPTPSRSAWLAFHLPMWWRRKIVARRGQVPSRLHQDDGVVYTWMDA